MQRTLETFRIWLFNIGKVHDVVDAESLQAQHYCFQGGIFDFRDLVWLAVAEVFLRVEAETVARPRSS